MIDLQDRLRRASELVSPSEPAYERLLRRRERRARNQRLVSASFALSLAAVVLVGVFAALGRLGSTERSGGRFGPVGRDTPEGLALGAGQYFYEKTTRILPDAPGSEGGTVVVETWWSPDGSGRKEAELTTSSYSPGPTGTWGPGGFPVMEQDLAELSTAPDELAIQLRERSAPGGASPQPSITPGPGLSVESGSLWRAVNDLLQMPNAVPELRAALFRVTAAIPSVRVVENTSDPAGRQAVALSFRSEGADRELFFDPRTFQFMARVENYGPEGTSYLIVDAAGIVDSTDERPDGQEVLFEPTVPDPPAPPIPTFAPTPPPIRPGEPIAMLDRFGNAVGFVPWKQAFGGPSGPPGALEEGFPWTPPGLQVPEVTVEEIRATARVSLFRLWTVVQSWWESRPKPASPDSAFLRWWASYPIGTEPVPLW